MLKFLKMVGATCIGVILAAILLGGAFLGIVTTFLAQTSTIKVKTPVRYPSILGLNLNQPILEREPPYQLSGLEDVPFLSKMEGLPLQQLIDSIKAAATDSSIKGLFLNLDDYSSELASTEALYEALIQFKKSGKPMVAFAHSYSESSYTLALACQKIYQYPYGDFEFNGLAMVVTYFATGLEKLKITPQIFRVGRYKSAVEPLIRNDMGAESREQNLELLNSIWSMLATKIATARNISLGKINELANDATMQNAQDALKNNFIDGVISLKEAQQKILQELKINSEKVDAEKKDHLFTPINEYIQATNDKKAQLITNTGKKIALIYILGNIISGTSSRNNTATGHETILEALRDIERDDNIAGLVVRINSPGGSALASDIIWKEMRQLSQKIPVVASMGDVAASGGYYIAAGANYIMASPQTITGSIGVFGIIFSAKDFFNQQLGIHFDAAKTHEHADMGPYARPLDAYEAKLIQTSVEKTYQRFLEVVQEARGFPSTAEVHKVAEGRVWSGSMAMAKGLVDELGNLEEAIVKTGRLAHIKGVPNVVVFPRKQHSLMQKLAEILEEEMKLSVFFRNSNTLLRPLQDIGDQWARLREHSGIRAELPYFNIKIQ